MALYYALVYVGDSIYVIYRAVRDFGLSFRGVWLLGDYLPGIFATLAVYISVIGSKFYNAADEWRSVYYELRNGVTLPQSVQNLIYYAEDIISFIRYPDQWIRDALARYYPIGVRFFTDPVGAVVDTLVRYTGFSYDFVYDPIGYIQQVVNSAMGQLQAIAQNPYAWIVGAINSTFPGAYQILTNPQGWIVNQVNNLFPSLNEFMRDPDSYIVDHAILFIENLLDRYGRRLAKIAERIIHMIY